MKTIVLSISKRNPNIQGTIINQSMLVPTLLEIIGSKQQIELLQVSRLALIILNKMTIYHCQISIEIANLEVMMVRK